MSDFLAFSGQHPFLAIAFAWLAFHVATWPFRLINRVIRHRNIVARGWPPDHLDADGDVVESDDPPVEREKWK